MTGVRFTRRALADLDAIAQRSLKVWGDSQTRIYLQAFEERFQWLAANPQLGRDRNDVAPGYRSFLQGRHIVFYIVQPDGIVIIGVPHQAMDVAAHLGKDP